MLAAAILALGALGAPAMAVAPSAVPDEGAATLDRIAGQSRFDTAAQTAVRAYPDGTDTVLVATGLNFPDALAASFLSGGGREAPILLVEREHVPQETRDALDQLDPSRIIVLGKTDAVAADTVQELADSYPDTDVDVIGGQTRIETAAMIAHRGGDIGTMRDLSDPTSTDELTTAIVARAGNFPDALASGPLALEGRHPILLTPTDTLDPVTRDALTDPDLGIEQVVVTGGTVAISQDVEDAIADLDNVASVHRVAGEDRTQTAVELGELTRSTLGWDASTMSLARGDFFPDALTVAPLAAQLDASLVLAQNPQTIGANTFVGLQDVCATIEDLLITGGDIAISPDAAGEAKLATICADETFSISGDQEVDDGDPDATGTGWLVVEGDTVCMTYAVDGLDAQADMSHIHLGEAGATGDPVIDLGAPDAGGFRSTCVDDADVASGITADPTDYYVNIHTPDLPQGAARGQIAATDSFRVYGAAENDDDPDTAGADADVTFGHGEDGLVGDVRLFLGDDTTLCVDLELPDGSPDPHGCPHPRGPRRRERPGAGDLRRARGPAGRVRLRDPRRRDHGRGHGGSHRRQPRRVLPERPHRDLPRRDRTRPAGRRRGRGPDGRGRGRQRRDRCRRPGRQRYGLGLPRVGRQPGRGLRGVARRGHRSADRRPHPPGRGRRQR